MRETKSARRARANIPRVLTVIRATSRDGAHVGNSRRDREALVAARGLLTGGLMVAECGGSLMPDLQHGQNLSQRPPRLPGSDLEFRGAPLARIYRPAPPPGRGGLGRFGKWTLELEPTVPPTVEPVMGWTESADPFATVQLHFPDLPSAIAFAERQGWRYQVRDPAVGAYRQARASARYDVSGALARVQDATRSIAARAAA